MRNDDQRVPYTRATRCRPAIAKSHEAGTERAHVYLILAATKKGHDDYGNSARRRHLGDNRTDRIQLKFHVKPHITKQSPKYLTKFES